MTIQQFKRYSYQDAFRDAAEWLDKHPEFEPNNVTVEREYDLVTLKMEKL